MSLITPDFGLIFWMTLIFAIVFFIVAKFGFPVITGMAGKRADKIAEGLRKAEEAEQRFAELSRSCEAMLSQTREKQAEMLKEATRSGEQIVAEAKAQAQKEAAKLLESEADIDDYVEKMRESLKQLLINCDGIQLK